MAHFSWSSQIQMDSQPTCGFLYVILWTLNVVSCCEQSLNMTHYKRKGTKALSYLSLLRKISCRMPISRSLWIIFSLLLEPGMTRLPMRVKGRGGVQGTLSSMVSWERRRDISNVCLSIISSRLAASPKSLILLTFTEIEGKKSDDHYWTNPTSIFRY